MRIAFLTIPSSGEANVQLATALQRKQLSEKRSAAIDFISLGSDRSVEDL